MIDYTIPATQPAASPPATSDLLNCPMCQQKTVMYDKMAQKYICLNNKGCRFINTTLEPIAESKLPKEVSTLEYLKDIKSLKDLKGKIIKDVRYVLDENCKTELIIEFEGTEKYLRILGIFNDLFEIAEISAKVISKKQIITYEEIEEDLDE